MQIFGESPMTSGIPGKILWKCLTDVIIGHLMYRKAVSRIVICFQSDIFRGCEHGLSDRWTRLSKAEQRTMLTLWNIFRSPLMIGCELTDMDEWTKALLTNEEVLSLLKTSRNAHQT